MRPASDIAAAVRSGQTSAAEVVALALGAIEEHDGRLSAFTQVFHQRAAEQAQAVDVRIANGEDLPLAGVPVALKDNICLAWGKTTCASRMLAEYASPFTATAAQRLVNAGAVIVGKTNLDEFAMGASGEHSFFGPSKNPWDESRTCGGSSCGSACAVAAGMASLALGSDTGGSIRQPASHTGTVGFKPTYGRVSRWGLVAFASSLDQIGPFASSVRDAALCYSIIAGVDERDLTSSSRPVVDSEPGGPLADLDTPIERLRIGVPKQARSGGNHEAVDEALRVAIGAMRDAGAEIVEVDLPNAGHAVAAYYLIAPAEASSNLSRFDGVRYGHRAENPVDLEDLYTRTRTEGFGPEVRRRIMLGTHILSSGYYDAYYLTALRARRLIKGDYDAVLGDEHGRDAHATEDLCDAILMPAAPGPAFRLGEKLGDPLALYLEDVYTAGVSLAGLPAITVPVRTAEVEGATLPVGMQLVGRAWGEAGLLRVARMLEQGVGFESSCAQ
ncbi:MAG: Asp-tRNA(Asn)/Glu-tRNA(Gln) amidotransferase subunit GatA [Phycisphaeraceae bacterium]|nr:MAG: Asp-tRNA(Asn)/Glu-tRNA(Gln) amidotransferase subunit GatA [Phycisphaeraceae bacterium]